VDRVGAQADLATLALGGEAASALGQDERAQAFFRRVEEQARTNPEPFARQWTQYCLERRLYLDETVATLESEVRVRPDVLGQQLLAVGYQLQGRSAEARATIQRALRLKTQDALLQYQASRILGDPVRQRLARRINPGVHRLPGSRVLN
jgi:tetratricopeptide (TPR) repeat protein